MFDAGIWEIALILLLALIIIGPKRLPEVASKLGEWVGKFKKLQGSFHHLYNHYQDYPNAGKHLLGIDSKSKNSNTFEVIKEEFKEIKKQVNASEYEITSDLNQQNDSKQSNQTNQTNHTSQSSDAKKTKKSGNKNR